MPKSFGHKWLDGPFSVPLAPLVVGGPLDLDHLHPDRKLEHSATGCGPQVDWELRKFVAL